MRGRNFKGVDERYGVDWGRAGRSVTSGDFPRFDFDIFNMLHYKRSPVLWGIYRTPGFFIFVGGY